MAKRERETADMEAFALRVVRSISRRAREGDMEAVEALSRLGLQVDCHLGAAVEALRAEPWRYSWTDIGQALGVTRQAAQQRFGVTESPAEG